MSAPMRCIRARRSTVPLAAAAFLVAGCAMGPKHPVRSPLGAPVEVVRTRGESVRGELLAVSTDSLWVRGARSEGAVLNALSMREIRVVRVHHGGVSMLPAMVPGALILVGSSMVREFSSVIGAFGMGVLLVGVERASLATLTITRPTPSALAPWARFPQGLPGHVLDSLPPRR